jgi:hypothetical protein
VVGVRGKFVEMWHRGSASDARADRGADSSPPAARLRSERASAMACVGARETSGVLNEEAAAPAVHSSLPCTERVEGLSRTHEIASGASLVAPRDPDVAPPSRGGIDDASDKMYPLKFTESVLQVMVKRRGPATFLASAHRETDARRRQS